jgi:DNA-binding MarR family transcriptional regulator
MGQINRILRDVQRCGRRYREEKLAPLGLSGRHGIYFKEIGDTPGISQEQLAQRLQLNKSNVARQVAAMEEEGYIQRIPCEADKRVLRLHLTQKAKALLPAVEAVTAAWEQQLVEGLTDAEQQILDILLQRLRESAMAALEEASE